MSSSDSFSVIESTPDDSISQLETLERGIQLETVECDDPIGQLEKHVRDVVGSFTDGHDIQKSIEQVKINQETFKDLAMVLMDQGDHLAAVHIVGHSRDVFDNSVRQALPMRKHVAAIANLLNKKIVDPRIQVDPRQLKEVVEDVRWHAQAAFNVAKTGQERLQGLMKAMYKLQVDHREKIEKAKKEVEKNRERAQKCQETAKKNQTTARQHNAISAASVVAPAAQVAGLGIAGAAAVAEVPVVGGLLTTTSGIFWTTTAFNPVGLAAAGTLCGTVAMLTAVRSKVLASDASHELQDALKEAQAAEKDAEESLAVIEKVQRCDKAAKTMLKTATFHEDMWRGISIGADGASAAFRSLDRTSQRSEFNEQMKEFASELLNLAEAIDMYLFFLHQQGLFPPNISLKRQMGPERFLLMESAWKVENIADKNLTEAASKSLGWDAKASRAPRP